MIPADTFRGWSRRYDPWQDLVFDLLSRRLSSVIEIVDEVAFRHMDARLASLLLDRAGRENLLRSTHQELASELGTSREVIGRLLEDFTERGLIRLARGEVEVLDSGGLKSRTGTWRPAARQIGRLCDLVTDRFSSST